MKTYSKIGLAIAVTLFGSTAHAALTSGVTGPETVLPETVQFRIAQADLDCTEDLTCAEEDGDKVSSGEGEGDEGGSGDEGEGDEGGSGDEGEGDEGGSGDEGEGDEGGSGDEGEGDEGGQD